MKKLFLLLAATTLMSVVTLKAQINDPHAELRTISSFHAIQVSSSFNVYLSQGETEALAVSAADDKFRDRIRSEVKDGVLKIWFDNGTGMNWNSGNKKLKAYISVKTLDKLTASGACDIYTDGTLKLESLTMIQSGASDFKGKLEVERLTVDLSGASDMLVSGKVTRLDVEASGASDFKGFDLVTETCNAKASGASDIKITVNKELTAEVSGASDVRYKGDGVIRDLKSSGASSVRKS